MTPYRREISTQYCWKFLSFAPICANYVILYFRHKRFSVGAVHSFCPISSQFRVRYLPVTSPLRWPEVPPQLCRHVVRYAENKERLGKAWVRRHRVTVLFYTSAIVRVTQSVTSHQHTVSIPLHTQPFNSSSQLSLKNDTSAFRISAWSTTVLTQVFRGFLPSFSKMPEQRLKLGQHRFLSRPSEPLLHSSSHHLTPWSLTDWKRHPANHYSAVQGVGSVESRRSPRTVWRSGEGWVFICLELRCDRVDCTNGGGETDWVRQAVAVLVNSCPPTVWEFHRPETVQRTMTPSLNFFSELVLGTNLCKSTDILWHCTAVWLTSRFSFYFFNL